MSYELAVVTTDVGVVREWRGFNGVYRFGPDDPGTLHDRLTTLISDDTLRRRLGCEARSFVAGRYQLAQAVERYIDLYQELIFGSRDD